MALIFWLFIVSCIAIAVWFGGRDGRIAAAMIAAATIATMPIQMAMPNWAHMSASLLASDSALFAGLFWLAIRSDRAWPVWMAGMQFNAVLASIATNLASDATQRIYAALETFWALPVLALMAVGVLLDASYQRRVPGERGEKERSASRVER